MKYGDKISGKENVWKNKQRPRESWESCKGVVIKFKDFWVKNHTDFITTQFQYNPSNDCGGGMKMKVVK